MSSTTKDQLYDSQSESEGDLVLPDFEFELVDKTSTRTVTSHKEEQATTDHSTQPQEEKEGEREEEEDQEEFDFPLFSFGGDETTPQDNAESTSTDTQERGRPQTITQKISLREPSIEKIIQSRPESYYFQRLTEQDHSNYESIAITYDQIIKHSTERNHFGKVWDLTEYNNKIEHHLSCDNRKKGRLGKKARLAKRVARENEKGREKVKKVEKQRELKKLMKKIHHKRGGKKNKKKGGAQDSGADKTAAAPARPKYRTE
ncbi:hypothetical protein WICPIJ_003417 [Wickerhamomyces pijperi]|uniref:Uncharacterized protein n=1 Tax=Wickerhamomyces pijperi TaxID=599730 RepID=A0A9P8Q9P6_WICPI|nr:hypothetical protein WICPIJ_003417 [Wickerhamomyces pijperi]